MIGQRMSWKRSFQVDLFQELIVDNFAGGGGASCGIELATGRPVDIAINHDPAAIAMHKANHPDTEHYCESVWDVDPRKVTRGRPVALCWLSPDCTHFSKAKGGKPRDKNIRGLAWVAVRWAATVRPRVIILENVEEFVTWGPLTPDGYPDQRQKGRTFRSFVNALRRHGYAVEWRELRACDYGAPTIRKRLFLIARCDGRPIVWPEPTHGVPDSPKVRSGKLKPWRTAAEIIDWSIPCPSIFERKRPLTENTLRRIARGIYKFVINNPKPFIAPVGPAFITKFRTGATGHPLDEPLHTVTSGAGSVRPAGAAHAMGLVTAFIARHFGESVGSSMNEPIGTVTAGGGGKSALVASFLLKYYGAGVGQACDEPLGTVTTRDRFGLVTIHGVDYQIIDIGMRMLEPHELFAAQGFPPDYIIDRDADGRPYPKYEQVARCGNSVPPPFAEALVRANLPELCVKPIRQPAAVV